MEARETILTDVSVTCGDNGKWGIRCRLNDQPQPQRMLHATEAMRYHALCRTASASVLQDYCYRLAKKYFLSGT